MRHALARAIARHPIVAGCVVVVGHHVLLFLAAALAPQPGIERWPDLGPTLVNATLTVAALLFIAVMWWWRETATRWRRPDRSWWLAVPVLVSVATFGAWGQHGSIGILAGSALLYVLVALNEELANRGLLQHMLRPLGMARAAIASGVIFGLGHLLSAYWFHRPIATALAQVASATAFGICFAAVRWHLGTLWPLIAIHALDDFLQANSARPIPWWWYLAITVGWLGYGCWLLTRLPASDPALARPAGVADPEPATGTA